jgi:hypothetical protein
MLEAHIFRTYQKDLRNLALQERRLRSQLKQHTAELLRLREERRAAAESAKESKESAAPKPTNGFEFSTPPGSPVPAAPASSPQDEISQKMEAAA